MRVVYTKELYYCYVKYFQFKKKKTKFEYGTNFSTILFVIDFIPSASMNCDIHILQDFLV